MRLAARSAVASPAGRRDAVLTVNHIGLFLADLHGGGAERMMVNLASGLATRGHRVDLVLADANGPYLADLDREVRLIDLGTKRVSRSVPGLVRYLRTERPRCLVSTLNHANVGAAIAHMIARVDCKHFIREANTPSTIRHRTVKDRAVMWATRFAYRYADGVLAVSDGVAQDLRESFGLDGAKVTPLVNPVVTPDLLRMAAENVEHPWFQTGRPPVVLGVGRLHHQKDFASLLRAFAIVRQSRVARLVILGEGPERPSLTRLASELGVADDVDLPGFVTNPFAFMSRAAVFALSSVREGLPGALIQAMATGCPVVATDCRSGPSEVLEGGRHGPLVPVGRPDALAVAIASTLDDPPDRQATRNAVRRYDSAVAIAAYEAFFDRAAAPRTAPRRGTA